MIAATTHRTPTATVTKKSKSRLEREAAERLQRERAEELLRAYGQSRQQTAGRGQEEFTGSFGDAFEAIRQARERRARSERERARRSRPEPAPGPSARGPMRPWAVGWRVVAHSYETDSIVTEAMGRTVMMASSRAACEARAPRWCLRDAQREKFGTGGFQIRYIKELK